MKTILIVDDEPHCLKLYEREFIEEGYEVLTAPDARSAIDLAARTEPDCVVVDIRLPDMDGLGLIQRLLARNPKTPVVINSAYHDAKDHFLSWCAKAYVVKSSDLDELKRAVAVTVSQAAAGAGAT